MVAECLKLGFSTRQSALTQQQQGKLDSCLSDMILNNRCSRITSPLLLAVLYGKNVVAHMLVESGTCSPTELLYLYEQLLEFSDSDTDNGRKLLELTLESAQHHAERQQRYEWLMSNISTFLPYLNEMVHNPRSLVSTCRLLISRCLTVRRRRERDVQQLSLPIRNRQGVVDPDETLPLPVGLKNYLLFSDLADSDYEWSLHGTLPPAVPKQATAVKRKIGRSVARRK
jgi:hypothetical protein